MSLFKQFATDTEKEEKGAEVTFGPNTDGTIPTFRIRRRDESNQRYVKALDRESQQYRRLIQLGTLSEDVSKRIMRRVFCSAVLVSWDNVQDDNDVNIPFNFENALSLFDKLPDLYYELASQAGQVALFRKAGLELDAKN